LRDPATGGWQSFRKAGLRQVRPLAGQSTMPAYAEASLPAPQLEDLVAYLVSDLPGQSRAVGAAPVPYQRIVEAESREPGSWLTYSGNYQGHRYSPLRDLTPANVVDLRVKWTYQFPLARTEVSPIVADGVMYISAPNRAAALDLRTGRPLWQWERPIPPDYQSIGFGRVNRGVAILDDKIFVATLDCHIVALDLKSGQERWSVRVEDYRPGYSMTLAPLAIKDKVIVGLSGGEAGIRGFLDAYDAATGKRAWRFYAIPGPGEKGHETWQGDSWKTGGASTWVTGAYDPSLNLVYWGIGNPGPDWNGDARQGDNLYTCSFVALDGDSGKLRWHFQFTPHDTHDWDATHVPMLLDAEVRGRKRKLIVNPNRNAFYYVLDRETGEFLAGREYAKQTWAKGLDDRGRPILAPGMEPSEQGTLVWPSLNGATVWFSPSYSPSTGLVYVSTREVGSTYYKREAEYKPGTFFAGGGETRIPEKEQWGAVRALEAATGRQVWEFRLRSAPWAGVLSTAGGLVFSGSNEGNIFALDAKTGRPLWDFQAGGPVAANPISFEIDGRQHIALAAGRVLYVFGR
jgi:alcohol dehydrogenase (cytochrome c)